MQIAICTHRSAKAGSVPDETSRAIDRIFDFVDNGVDALDHALNRHKYTEEQLQQLQKRRKREVIDADPAPKPKAAPKQPSTAVVAKKPRFYIVESVDPKSGDTLFVVTDGGNARAECTTRELAGQILRALEKKAP